MAPFLWIYGSLYRRFFSCTRRFRPGFIGFDLNQRLVLNRRQRLPHPLRARRRLFLRRLLFHGPDLVGIGLDLLEVRRPFELDRYSRHRVTRGRGRGHWRRRCKRRRLAQLEFPQLICLDRSACRRFVVRRAGRHGSHHHWGKLGIIGFRDRCMVLVCRPVGSAVRFVLEFALGRALRLTLRLLAV